jgi:hypothetical protein
MVRFDSRLSALLLGAALAAGCGDNGSSGDDDGDDDAPTIDANQPDAEDPDAGPPAARYEFPSRFDSTMSSVAYDGQVARLTWIFEMSRWIDRINTNVTGGQDTTDGQVVTDLDTYYRYEQAFETTPLLLTTTPPLLQATMGALSTSANLRTKMAGLDSDAATVMYKDWSTGLQGWSGVTSPDALVTLWIGMLDDAADTYNQTPPLDPSGNAIPKVFVTSSGIDLRELLQKFLLGAVALSQASDDYLDDATPDKGILTSNARSGEALYTGLEHSWDEGFGYFGAPRDYGDYTDEEIAAAGGRPEYASGYHDTDGDVHINLRSEYVMATASNAAKRDRGSDATAPTDFSGDAWDAFLAGRQLIASVDGELSTAQLDQLKAHRDAAVLAWEKTIAATVVHYINDVLKDMNSATYSFVDHAKHWSEMKGFALSLQFNPRSPMLEDFVQFHTLVGDAPVLMNAGETAIADYKQALRDARALIGTAYGFTAANLGDDNGENGW